MKQTLKTLVLSGIFVALAGSASAADCRQFHPGSIDRSEYSIEQIKAGLVRGPFFWSTDLNGSGVFKDTFNEICLKEMAYVLTLKKNPYPNDEYINDLVDNNRLNPEQPETLALYINNADEPVTNPIFGQMISLVFERGMGLEKDECFTFDIQVTSKGPEVLLYTLVVSKVDTWWFEVTELSREILTQEALQAVKINDEL